VLVLDGAGWHVAKDLKVPEGLHLEEFLPARSPELQPTERLWSLVNEGVSPTAPSRTWTSWRGRWSSGAWLSLSAPTC
jgi:transposase